MCHVCQYPDVCCAGNPDVRNSVLSLVCCGNYLKILILGHFRTRCGDRVEPGSQE